MLRIKVNTDEGVTLPTSMLAGDNESNAMLASALFCAECTPVDGYSHNHDDHKDVVLSFYENVSRLGYTVEFKAREMSAITSYLYDIRIARNELCDRPMDISRNELMEVLDNVEAFGGDERTLRMIRGAWHLDNSWKCTE